MNSFYIFGLSFSLGVLFVFLSKILSIQFGIYDLPQNSLAIHTRPLPYLGGVGIFFAVIITMILASTFAFRELNLFTLRGIVGAGLIAFLIGLWDDLWWKRRKEYYRPRVKFILQLAGSVVMGMILTREGISIKFIPLGTVGLLLGIFYIFGGMNGINMQDGMDGLAGGLVVISALGFLGLSLLKNNPLGLLISLSTLGAVLGFLIYNFPPASIFMGDGGSHFLGFGMATLALIFTSKPYDWGQFIGPILIIGLPVADAGWTPLRRFFQRKELFRGDRGHFYDRLRQKGASTRKTLFICWFLQFALVLGGVILYG